MARPTSSTDEAAVPAARTSRRSQAAPGLPGRSVAADGDISGIASTGDHAINVQYRAEQMTVLPAEAFRPWAELAVPPGLGNLPVRPGLFVGRAGELARLDAALAGPGGVVVQAVHGLGGIGKSTLAAHWAAAHASDYTLTWWITADTPAGIDAGPGGPGGRAAAGAVGCAAAGGAAGRGGAVAGRPPGVAAGPGQRDRPGRHRAAAGPGPGRPVPDHQPAGDRLARHRRAGPPGCPGPGRGGGSAHQDPHPDRPRELDGAGELCAELGFLPLAIEQAGAYLAEAGVTPREYLELLADYPAAMYQATAEGGDAARTIARIWRVTLDRLADDPLAGQVLRILAWYAPDAIPRALLDGLADPPALLQADRPPGRLQHAHRRRQDVLAMHRLVQAVTRTPDPGDPHRSPQAIDDARDQATRQLAAALPDRAGPGRMADMADATPAHRRPGQPRATGH